MRVLLLQREKRQAGVDFVASSLRVREARLGNPLSPSLQLDCEKLPSPAGDRRLPTAGVCASPPFFPFGKTDARPTHLVFGSLALDRELDFGTPPHFRPVTVQRIEPFI